MLYISLEVCFARWAMSFWLVSMHVLVSHGHCHLVVYRRLHSFASGHALRMLKEIENSTKTVVLAFDLVDSTGDAVWNN